MYLYLIGARDASRGPGTNKSGRRNSPPIFHLSSAHFPCCCATPARTFCFLRRCCTAEVLAVSSVTAIAKIVNSSSCATGVAQRGISASSRWSVGVGPGARTACAERHCWTSQQWHPCVMSDRDNRHDPVGANGMRDFKERSSYVVGASCVCGEVAGKICFFCPLELRLADRKRSAGVVYVYTLSGSWSSIDVCGPCLLLAKSSAAVRGERISEDRRRTRRPAALSFG